MGNIHFSRILKLPEEINKKNPYFHSQIVHTLYGIFITVVVLIFYCMYYLLSCHYMLALTHLLIVLILASFTPFFLRNPVKRQKIIVHIIVFIVYLTIIISTINTGGLASSSLLWFALIPVIAVVMSGIKTGVQWGIVTVITLVLYFTDNFFLSILPVKGQSSAIDIFVDILVLTNAASSVIMLSDYSKKKTFNEIKKIEAELIKLATIDSLTGLFNRQSFTDRAEEELKRVLRYEKNISISMIDIDNFKTINDQSGHEAGDRALKSVSGIIKQSLREIDIVGRYGGDEFIVLFPESSLGDAAQALERIRVNVEKNVQKEMSLDFPVTISAGVASMSTDNPATFDQFMAQADAALYRSKNEGKNRITIGGVFKGK